MIVNYDEEMRKALESMKDAPYDYFESGCSFCGEAVEWALKTIDSQRAEIEQLKEQAQKEKRGYWALTAHGTKFVCSCCNRIGTTRHNFCPHCGADMRTNDGAG